MAERAEDAGGLPAGRSGQRVAVASAVVRRKAPSAICWARISPWPARTICTGVWTSCWRIRPELFSFLQQRWKTLFQAEFEILLYDLTSTYFECDPPEAGKRRFGYSRDNRSDCVQVVIALIVTPEGFPLAYEVMPGNTSDKTTLRDFLRRIEAQYGKAGRTWVMDRGIPTEAVLAEMRASETPTHYLVGTPRGRLSQMEQEFLARPWAEVRDFGSGEAD